MSVLLPNDNDNSEIFLDSKLQSSVDWQRVQSRLSEDGFALSISSAPRQFSSGAANLNFLVSVDGRPAVFRRPPDGELPKGANDIEREYKVLSKLWRHYPLAPKGLYYCPDLDVIGVPFCLSEYVQGVVIRDKLPAMLNSIDGVGAMLGRGVLDALLALHSVDYVSAGLADLGRPQNYLERQISGWLRRGEAVFNQIQCMALRSVCSWLNVALPISRPICIVHNDFKLDNMLLNMDTLEVQGVVDWDMCTLGDPILELAILLLYWGNSNDRTPYTILARMPHTANGWMSRREVLDYYLSRSGVSLCESELKFYVVLALARFAVVFAQLRQLHSRGAIKSAAFNYEKPSAVDEIIDEILAHALELRHGDLPW